VLWGSRDLSAFLELQIGNNIKFDGTFSSGLVGKMPLCFKSLNKILHTHK